MLLHFLRDTGKLVPTSVHPHHVLTDGMLLHPNPLCYHTDSAGNSCATICQSCLASRGYAFLDQLHFQGGLMNSFIINAAITDCSYWSTDHILYGTIQLDDDLPQLCVQARMYYIEAKVHAKPLPPHFLSERLC